MKLNNLAIITIAIASLTSCSDDDLTGGNKLSKVLNAPKYTNSISLSAEEQKVDEAINDFSVDFINSIFCDDNLSQKLENDGNITYSPLSTTYCLGLAVNTCDDASGKQIAGIMNCNDVSTFTDVCHKLLLYLPHSDNGTELLFGNSIWFSDSYVVSNDYVRNINSLFNAEVYNVNFGDSSTTNLINSWVSQKTENKINNYLTDTQGYNALLCSTLYFIGDWSSKFVESNTKTSEFYGTNRTQSVQLMKNVDTFDTFSLDDCTAISLNFKNKKAEMIFILPNEDISIDEFSKSLDSKKFNELLATRSSSFAQIYIPKFDIEQKLSLTDALAKLNMPETISLSKAGIDANLLCQVTQKTCASVAESGVIIASATTIGGITDSAQPEIEMEFKVNRPFMYFVRNKVTGTILVEGRICNF